MRLGQKTHVEGVLARHGVGGIAEVIGSDTET